jgi:hypothetical protein
MSLGQSQEITWISVLLNAEFCMLVNYEMSCSEFSELIKTKPALLKTAQGTEKYDFKNKVKQEPSQKLNVHEVR